MTIKAGLLQATRSSELGVRSFTRSVEEPNRIRTIDKQSDLAFVRQQRIVQGSSCQGRSHARMPLECFRKRGSSAFERHSLMECSRHQLSTESYELNAGLTNRVDQLVYPVSL